jgi:hypothetical protein
MRSTAVAGAEIHSADPEELVRLARRLRPLQQGAMWHELVGSALGIVLLLIRKTPEARNLVGDKPGHGEAICVPISESVATLHVHDCMYLIESEAPWTSLSEHTIWIPPLGPMVTLLAEPDRDDIAMH